MSHVRQQIRERIAANVTGLTTTGSNVFASRVYNISTSELPALLVYAISESSERDSFLSTNGLERSVDILVEGYATTSANLDSVLDTISAEVETAVAGDPTCNGLCKDIFLSNTDVDLTPDGQKPVGSIKLTFECTYRTTTIAPQTAI